MPTQITPLPTPPSRNDPANFSTRADAFLGQLPTFATEANALVLETNGKALEAANSATASANSASASANSATASANSASNALSSAANAAAATGAALWVSGTTYAVGALVWSPINARVYRRLVAGVGTTDPSSDATNWKVLSTVVEQEDIGTEPNQIPLNQYLGNLAYMNNNNLSTVDQIFSQSASGPNYGNLKPNEITFRFYESSPGYAPYVYIIGKNTDNSVWRAAIRLDFQIS